jgi:hypothetical protein
VAARLHDTADTKQGKRRENKGPCMLEQIFWVASVVGAVAIVMSAVYASIQIRHNTRSDRASAFQQVVNSFASISFDIAKDKTLVDLYLRAGRDITSLDELERAQYRLMLLSFLRRAENVLFQTSTRVLLSEHWSGIRDSIKAILAPPGARLCWGEMKNLVNPEFRAFIDSLITEQTQAAPHFGVVRPVGSEIPIKPRSESETMRGNAAAKRSG